ncbi:MAG: c-type cytochrome [Gammaproteobacteria bacterium]|nr:c-type cytochrome [Gammaproteobacteria bacterium]
MPLIQRLHRFIAACVVCTLGSAAPAAWATDDGAKLYAHHCAACHGSRGTGGVGVPLALPDFLAAADDNFLRKTIRLGRPGRVMPAFRQLSDAEVDTLIRYIRGWAPTGTSKAAIEKSSIKGNVERGGKLYARYCAACHGAHGEGGHGTGVTFSRPRDLPVLAPALNNPGLLAAASDATIKTTLMRGRRGTPMPSFLKLGLKEQDIDDLVVYVRAFKPETLPDPVQSMADEPPVIERASPYDMDKTVERLKEAIGAANMRLIRTESFDRTFSEDSRENKRHVVVDSCDFDFLNQALKIDPRVGLFLPCRFTLSERDGKVSVSTINPKRLSAIFNNSELNQLCDKMHKVYVDILEEATF